jgi:DNA-binding MarR family transcriptional regulator
VTITEAGRSHFQEVAAEHHHWIGGMLAGMSADRHEQLYDLLAELKHSLAGDTKES